ncbi:hypothetical protein B0H10DRAFT_2429204 [Mycena sp. CBHHK59/15]|nr:hypothetical protein B0H10DRAFT_2429204 [Mycena sp. CBHHK59/15]
MKPDSACETSAPSLPAELWLYIYRLATAYISPLVAIRNSGYQYVVPKDPLEDIRYILREACSMVLVCRSWNSLAREILYENIRVGHHFSALSAALDQPDTARLVRSIRFSPFHFESNRIVLKKCHLVEVVVQPDVTVTTGILHPLHLDTPPLLSLKHVYWTESAFSAPLLRSVLGAAPNLEYVSLNRSTSLGSYDRDGLLPPIPSMRCLNIVASTSSPITAILPTDVQRLTRLFCNPRDITSDAPALPALRTLELFGSRMNIPFPAIQSRCPQLRELCYDVWNTASEPQATHPSLSCIRLHSMVSVVRDWTSIERHFGLFCGPSFPGLQRVVLYGQWYRVIVDPRFAALRGTSARGPAVSSFRREM